MPKFLTSEQQKFYQDNGYVKVNVLTKDEIDRLSEEYDELFRLQANEDMDATWEGEGMEKVKNHMHTTMKSLHGLQMFSELFHKFLMNKNLLDALEDCMGTKNIALHHTKAHIKPPKNGTPYPMHQDYPYFPYKNHSMCAVFLHMDDTSPENGGLCVYPGSHKLGPLPTVKTVANGLNYYYCDVDKYPIEGGTPVHAKKGEVVIFSYLLLHGSYLNTSDRVRRMFLVQVMDADDEPIEDTHRSPAQGLMLRGIKRTLDRETSTYRKNPNAH